MNAFYGCVSRTVVLLKSTPASCATKHVINSMRWIQTTRWLREYVDIDGVSTSLDDTDTRLNKDEHKTVLIEDPNNHLLHQLLSSSTPHVSSFFLGGEGGDASAA